MTPLAVSMLMHFNGIAEKFPGYENGPQQEIISEFIYNGIIKTTNQPDDFIYTTTGRGGKLVQMILNTPYPIKQWVDSRMIDNPTPEECYDCPHKTKPCDSRQVDCPNAVKPKFE